MGPNLYVTPPGSFTHFHQDGHGTVDSGHMCIDGYNEVIMLRRMNERHKKHALHLLTCADRCKGNGVQYDALYGLPHHNGKKPLWPDIESIKKCKKMNYYPCVFVLKPGQFLHINKGRLHAFRKANSERLDKFDCHKILREDLVKQKHLTKDIICKSVAWDWMYTGVTEDGIKAEVTETLSSSKLAVLNGVLSLAIPESCISALARNYIASYKATSNQTYISKLKGIYPGLNQIMKQQLKEFENAKSQASDQNVIIEDKPDSKKNPEKVTIDPFGNDFFCRLCRKELSNIYMHCEGCEVLLEKDFNICNDCHRRERLHPRPFQMHPTRKINGTSAGARTDFNHHPQKNSGRRMCGCKNGPVCRVCKYRVCCSCICHQKYSLRMRFHDASEIISLLEEVRSCIGLTSTEDEEDYGFETVRDMHISLTPCIPVSEQNSTIQMSTRSSKHLSSVSKEAPTTKEITANRPLTEDMDRDKILEISARTSVLEEDSAGCKKKMADLEEKLHNLEKMTRRTENKVKEQDQDFKILIRGLDTVSMLQCQIIIQEKKIDKLAKGNQPPTDIMHGEPDEASV